ncbi:MAG TPA: hypothetical protein V6D33_04220 [Cyanophyceae cyanobacterium]
MSDASQDKSSEEEEFSVSKSLHEFSQRLNYISALETNGKISPIEAYEEVEFMWYHLTRVMQEEQIG